MKLTIGSCLLCALMSLLTIGCATKHGEVRGISTTSPDRQTQLVGKINGEGNRKIPVTETHGQY